MKTQSLIAVLAFISCSLCAQQWVDPMYARNAGPDPETTTRSFYMPNKFIKPVLPALDKKHEIKMVDAHAGGSIPTSSGTVITIPAKAFVDRDGKPVEGEVQIDYRQFSNPLDFIASGIPMTYKDKGATKTFESAGMFEVSASQNGNEVFLKSGKNIKVDMITTDKSDNYNFYVLDPEKGWVEKGKAAEAKTTVATKMKSKILKSEMPSEACGRFMELLGKNKPSLPSDSTLMEVRFDSLNYFYTKKFEIKKEAYLVGWRNGKEVRMNNLVNLTRIKSPVKGELAFEIKYKSKFHPEMSSFSGMKWVVTDNESNTSFRKKYGYRARFNDIRIIRDGDQFTLRLKGRDGFVDLHATPMTGSEFYATERNPKDHSKDFNSYTRTLDRRIKSHDKVILKALARYHNWKEHIESYAWNKVKNRMNEKERAMTLNEWEKYCIAQRSGMAGLTTAAMQKNEVVSRSLKLKSFGVFNCDRYTNQTAPIFVTAVFKNESDSILTPVMVYVVDKSINGFFSWPVSTGGTAGFEMGSRSKNMLLAVDAQGNLSAVRPENVKNPLEKSGKNYVFKAKQLPSDPIALLEFLKE